MNPVQTLKHFLASHHLQDKKVLLALSGGPDSMALFYSLLQCEPQQFGVAHVDHGWRRESKREAMELKRFVESFSLPWHELTLNQENMQGNLEDACRNARIDFFIELCQKEGYAGVLLAHHADDQAETVLKRVLEGASPPALKGMTETVLRQDVSFLRPFLAIRKRNLYEWLKGNHYRWFEDPTNRDTKYLRSNMRMQIIPYLSEVFGKEVTNPLCHLGCEMSDLQDFITEQIEQHVPPLIHGWAGWMANLEKLPHLHHFVAKQMIRQLLGKASINASYQQVEDMVRDIQANTANKLYVVGKHSIHIDRSYLFAGEAIEAEDETLPVGPGKFSWNGWTVHVEEVQAAHNQASWEQVWRGKAQVILPKGDYVLKKGNPKDYYPLHSKELGRWWTENKVPAFLRGAVPVIYHHQQVIADFLTEGGKAPENGWKVQIESTK